MTDGTSSNPLDDCPSSSSAGANAVDATRASVESDEAVQRGKAAGAPSRTKVDGLTSGVAAADEGLAVKGMADMREGDAESGTEGSADEDEGDDEDETDDDEDGDDDEDEDEDDDEDCK